MAATVGHLLLLSVGALPPGLARRIRKKAIRPMTPETLYRIPLCDIQAVTVA